jgi:UDP-N-acetylglucosamine--N-acetylmuramyl-(pentapeptide) pyrophosphoryl-undecaprenol N-acetylglucosamine transferase
MRSLMLAGAAPRACRRILRARRPDVVLGAGGFVAGPMVFAASTMGIPTALTEADAHLGLANRLAAPFARRLFLAYPLETRWRRKTRVVGRPLPGGADTVPQGEAREIFELPAAGPVLGVFGALAGATALNEFVVETWGQSGPAILHQTGRRDYELVKRRARRDDYRVIPETDRFGAALSACDLVLARAGSSVWEIAAAGKPAILVPYPFATGDHQALNAQHFVRAGGAIMVRELDLDDVPELVRSLLGDAARLRRMGEAMRGAARPGAAGEIADELIALATA